jgi:hypothetical protein
VSDTSHPNAGGPAFPEHPLEHDHYWHEGASGMSLRDYFAGQALVMLPHMGGGADLSPDDIAHDAYVFADAMLEHRAKAKEAANG